LENGVIEDFKTIPPTAWIWSQSKTKLPYQGMPIGRTIQLKAEDVERMQFESQTLD
jgi:putative ABC transport system permease protein